MGRWSLRNTLLVMISIVFWFAIISFFAISPIDHNSTDSIPGDNSRRIENLVEREAKLLERERRLRELEEKYSLQLDPNQPATTVAKEPVGGNHQKEEPEVNVDIHPVITQVASNTFGVDEEKREAVKQALLHAWNGYKTRAWGEDEVQPVDGAPHTMLGLGMTIVDSLDTLWIMGLKEEFQEARDWIDQHMTFNKRREVSFFETTIRVLGGLLSAYELSHDTMFLDKAMDLGDRFLPVFDTPSGIPMCSVNLDTGAVRNPGWTGGSSILSEVGTVQLEFSYLSRRTQNPIYREKALKVYDVLDKAEKVRGGLYPVYVSPTTGKFSKAHVTLGALGDSFYEYLLKYWILTGKKEDKYRRMYDEAADAITTHLIKKSHPNGLTYIAELISDRIVNKMDHLVCFAGGMFALGAQGETAQHHMEVGAGVTETCHQMYVRTKTGISAELVNFEGNNDFVVPVNARHYLLRPEAVESFFVLWRQTHDPKYRDMGWQAFQAIEKHCKAQWGYSGIRDVNSDTPTKDNLQQSFFLAETLKYLYLLFSEDELIPLDKYVFNTEAHPFGIEGQTW